MDSNSPFEDLLFPCSPNLAQKPWYLVGTVLKGVQNEAGTCKIDSMIEHMEESM